MGDIRPKTLESLSGGKGAYPSDEALSPGGWDQLGPPAGVERPDHFRGLFLQPGERGDCFPTAETDRLSAVGHCEPGFIGAERGCDNRFGVGAYIGQDLAGPRSVTEMSATASRKRSLRSERSRSDCAQRKSR